MMLSGNSNRRFFRKPVQIVVVVRKAHLKSGEVKDYSAERFVAQDISAGGIGLVGQHEFEPGTVLDIEFKLLAADEMQFNVQVEVRNNKPFGRNPKPVVVGTQFISLTPEQTEALRNLASVSFLA